MQVSRIIETCLYVEDLEAAETFYTGVLGLSVLSKVEGRHVFFRCGEGMFLLFNPRRTQQIEGTVPSHGANGAGHVAFALNATDIAAWRAYLHANDIVIEADFAWPHGGHSLYLRDPAGNSVELTTPRTWGLSEAA